jgi:hypothetical protein
MKTHKHFLLAAALMLVVGLCYSAVAQSNAKSTAFRLPPEPIGTVVSVNAIEISDGTLGFDSQYKNETAFGYSFLGRTTGDFPGSFTLSMNCTPAVAVPGDTSLMTGGVWTLPVYISGIRGVSDYAGSMYGTIANGKMIWDKTGRNAEIYFVLNVDGGTQTWQGVSGYASFTGNLVVDEKAGGKVLTGNLVFNILNAATE